MRVKFEVKQYFDEKGFFSKGIFVDGELFDWGLDEQSQLHAEELLQLAKKKGPEHVRALKLNIQSDIQRHFIDCLSEFIGRKVTIQEVNEATKTGWIEK